MPFIFPRLVIFFLDNLDRLPNETAVENHARKILLRGICTKTLACRTEHSIAFNKSRLDCKSRVKVGLQQQQLSSKLIIGTVNLDA
jgi:hypothetical protein